MHFISCLAVKHAFTYESNMHRHSMRDSRSAMIIMFVMMKCVIAFNKCRFMKRKSHFIFITAIGNVGKINGLCLNIQYEK